LELFISFLLEQILPQTQWRYSSFHVPAQLRDRQRGQKHQSFSKRFITSQQI
jgi:hypothetical protein